MSKRECNELIDLREMLILKLNMVKHGIVPVIKDNILNIYIVKGNYKLSDLIVDFDKYIYELYDRVILNDFEGINFNFDNDSNYDKVYSYRNPSVEDMHKLYDFKNDECIEHFVRNNQKNISCINAENGKLETRKENYDEILSRLSKDYIVCEFKKYSKISSIINYFNYNGCFDLDFVSGQICKWFLFNNKKMWNNNNISEEQNIITYSDFIDKEMELSDIDKIDFLRKVVDCLDIECVYCKDYDEIPKSILQVIFETKNYSLIRCLGEHNCDILEHSEFTPIYKKIFEEKGKTLVKR